MKCSKVMLALTALALSLPLLALPVSAHGGCHGWSGRTAVQCCAQCGSVCDQGVCPNGCVPLQNCQGGGRHGGHHHHC